MFTFETVSFTVLVLIAVFSTKENKGETFLSRHNSNYLRGIFALLIMIFHVSKETDVLYPVFHYFSIVVVGMFFFISGYGLMKGFMNNVDYRNTYLKKRFVKVLFPYIIMTLVYWIYNALTGNAYSITEVVTRIVTFAPIVMYSWFLISLIIQYFYFYVLMVFFEKTKCITSAVVFLCIIDILLAVFLNYDDAIIFNLYFGLGILYSYKEKNINSMIKSRGIVLFALSLVLTIIVKFINPQFIPMEVIKVLDILLFIIMILCFASMFAFDNRFLSYCGKTSMEIYMLQGLSKMIIRRYYGGPLFIQDLAIYILCFILSFVFHNLFLVLNKSLIDNK